MDSETLDRLAQLYTKVKSGGPMPLLAYPRQCWELIDATPALLAAARRTAPAEALLQEWVDTDPYHSEISCLPSCPYQKARAFLNAAPAGSGE